MFLSRKLDSICKNELLYQHVNFLCKSNKKLFSIQLFGVHPPYTTRNLAERCSSYSVQRHKVNYNNEYEEHDNHIGV